MSEAAVYPCEPRFDLRKAAGQIADQFISFALKELQSASTKFVPALTYCLSGDEATFIVEEHEVSVSSPSADYFMAVEDISIEVWACVSADVELSEGGVDAAYLYAPDDEEDAGLIIAWVSLPGDRSDAIEFLKGLARDLRGHLAHEMQHSIQKIVYGRVIGDVTMQGVEAHMRDSNEIGARVEEIIAQLKDGESESDARAFASDLKSYIEKYLERNLEKGKNDTRYLVFYEEMLSTHLRAYRRKIGIEKSDAAS